MKVTLLNSTTNARDLLIFSKKTRLRMTPYDFTSIQIMTDEEKDKELEYVFGTIGSSWEFVDYIFMIEGVTRAFTHQLVRHRVGVSFAQQAQRVAEMDNFEYLTTGSAIGNPTYEETMETIQTNYNNMITSGVHPQDARGVLPTNILTNIMMKINLRALSGLMNVRLCVKAQGEFQNVAREMKRAVLKVHPWAEPVLQVNCVHHGSCEFKGYTECPVKKAGLLPEVDTERIKELWQNQRSEAQPKSDK